MNPLYKVFSVVEIVVTWQESGAAYSGIITASDLPTSIQRILKDLGARK